MMCFEVDKYGHGGRVLASKMNCFIVGTTGARPRRNELRRRGCAGKMYFRKKYTERVCVFPSVEH